MQVRKLLLSGTIAIALGIPGIAGQAQRPSVRAAAGNSISFLGVGIQEINSDRAKTLGLPEEAGVEVTGVEPNSPAASAGLKAGDVVLEYNGQKVEGMEQFSRLVRETPAGREVKLNIFRNGAQQTMTAKIGSRPAGPAAGGWTSAPFNLRLPDIPRNLLSWRSSVLGVEAETLDGQLAEYFGVQEGVLVRSVIKGSAADKAGIKAGDVITKVSDSKVANPAEISSRIRSLQGQSVPVTLTRNHKEITLTVTLDNSDRSERLFDLPNFFAAFGRRVLL